MPPSVSKSVTEMRMARIYNDYTGSNITHFELQELGVREFNEVLAAISAWGTMTAIEQYRQENDISTANNNK